MDSTYNLNGGYKPTLKRFADLDGPDFFPTPEWATLALMDNESFEGLIWEPACGDGANRYRTIFPVAPPARIWVFSERITFYPAGAIKKGTGTTAYAWFVWEKNWARQTELKWFKPGYRRYSQEAESGAKPILKRLMNNY